MKTKIAFALITGFLIGDIANTLYNRKAVKKLLMDNEDLVKHDKAVTRLANLYCDILNKNNVPMDAFEHIAMEELLSETR